MKSSWQSCDSTYQRVPPTADASIHASGFLLRRMLAEPSTLYWLSLGKDLIVANSLNPLNKVSLCTESTRLIRGNVFDNYRVLA
jgi:hypothetical protein